MEATHASFFSGAGGLDLGLERAGWRTVSFSEIDPYACAVLAERWPGVPNLGDIVRLAARGAESPAGLEPNIRDATLWSGGFPCQDLSVAGKRAGFAGARSGLAFAFLDLVGRYRPRAVLLENVPGLLSSHAGRDFATLLDTLGQLGYGWAYRVLDAQHFGVPQRRRRVFILALDASRGPGADRAAEVLSVGSRCDRHPATGHEAGPGAAERAVGGVDIARTVTGTSGKRHDEDTDTLVPTLRVGGRASGAGSSYDNTPWTLVAGHEFREVMADGGGGICECGERLSASAHAGGVRAPDGLAGRLDDRGGVAKSLLAKGNDSHAHDLDNYVVATLNSGGNSGGFRTEPGEHLVYRKATKAHSSDDWERWESTERADTLDAEGLGALQATAIVGNAVRAGGHGDPGIGRDGDEWRLTIGQPAADSDLLPLGLDSHRYRCCGNGVVSSVAEWIGRRLLETLS